MSGVSGGDRMEGVLRHLAERLDAGTLAVGFLENSTYPDGTSLPMVAAVQEFGGSIAMPARTQTIYRRLNKDGDFLRRARFVKRRDSNFATEHAVGAHTITIPARPYFRNMIKACSPGWGKRLAAALKACDYDAKRALGRMGMHMRGELQQSIRDTNAPPLARSTVRRKGFSKPLIETGHMWNSVDYEITE